jgi:hypothetical protein
VSAAPIGIQPLPRIGVPGTELAPDSDFRIWRFLCHRAATSKLGLSNPLKSHSEQGPNLEEEKAAGGSSTPLQISLSLRSSCSSGFSLSMSVPARDQRSRVEPSGAPRAFMIATEKIGR